MLPDLAFEFLMSGHIPQVAQPGQPHDDGEEGHPDEEADYGDEDVDMANFNLNADQL